MTGKGNVKKKGEENRGKGESENMHWNLRVYETLIKIGSERETV